MKTETKICKDCKHWSFESNASKCNHTLSLVVKESTNLITGAVSSSVYRDCAHMRYYSSCGKQGELFEPRTSLLKDFINFIKGKWE